MTHQRNRSEGLNVGEGFPTTYSSFAVTADHRTEARRSSATQHESSKYGTSSGMKRRTSSPPRNSAYPPARLRGNNQSPARFAFESDMGISTTKKFEGLVKEYRKRWSFLIFFFLFSALLVFGVALPFSRQRVSSATKPGVVRREIAYRSTRVKVPEATPVAQHAKPGRFAQWAASFFGSDSAAQPVVFPAAMDSKDVPDYSTRSTVAQGTDVKMADKVPSRRSQKRMAEDAQGREDREHPSRVQRRAKLQASSLAEEDRLREAEMAKQRQIRRRVMERVAKAFKSGNAEPRRPEVVADNPEGEHVLDIYEAAHPETVEMESDFVSE